MITTDTPAWLSDLMACIDHRDAEGFGEFVTQDARFYFANAPAVSGREAIVAAVREFFQAIAGISHRIDLTLSTPDHLAIRGDVTYTRLDGGEVTVPFANIFELTGERISDYRIYADLAPLWAETPA